MNSSRVHFAVAIFCAFMGIVVPALIVVLMFTTSRGMSAPEALYGFASTNGQFSSEQLATLSAGVKHVHQQRFGSSLQEIVFLLYPLTFLALAGLHLVLGVNTQISEIHQRPNKAPEPTSGTVTPPAEPGVAPGSDVAHL